MRSHKKTLYIIAFLTSIVICFIKCDNRPVTKQDSRGSSYAGAAACISCHRDVVNSYMHTSHYKSSSRASYVDLKNIIDSNDNVIAYENNQRVSIKEIHSNFFQSYSNNGRLVKSEKMDIAFGSGKDAQTFSYWKDSQLYELPLSYLVSQKIFTNSPGFPINEPYFTRVIPSRCLECHTSFVSFREVRENGLLIMNEKFDSSSLIYGIDCERCHGPGAEHVQFQTNNPNVKQAKFITKIKSLTRQQQLDLCGTCHSGDPVKMRSIFAFTPGDTLSKYYFFYKNASLKPDVHGMQLQSLQLSECFLQSTLTCITCHQAHEPDDKIQTIIGKCISCHPHSPQHAAQTNAGNNNCITCHMPSQSSKSLDFNNQTAGGGIAYFLRTHRIAIYPKSEWK